MRLVSRDRLVAACREAGAATVAEFVADLYAARGYTVERPGEGLLALDPGGRTVAVRPDGGPVPPAADAVVALDPETVRSDREDLEVVSAESLHEQVSYAIDRAVARELLATHFGVEADERPAGARDSKDHDGGPLGTDDHAGENRRTVVDRIGEMTRSRATSVLPVWPANRRQVVIAAVAGVVLLAALASGGILASSGGDVVMNGDKQTSSAPPGTETAASDGGSASPASSSTRTATPAEDPPNGDAIATASLGEDPRPESLGDATRQARSYPPGIDEGGLDDIDELIATHRSHISNTSYTMTIQYREFENGKVTGIYVETVRVVNRSRYRVSVTTTGTLRTTPRPIVGGDVFASEGTQQVRTETTQSYVTRRPSPRRFLGQISRYLRWSLSARNSTLRGRQPGDNRTVYRVTTDGDPFDGIRDASGTVYVTESGLITYGRWTFVTVRPETRVEFSVRTTDVGATTVSRPDWIDEE